MCALGIFFGIALVALVWMLYHDWDDSKPGQQGFTDRKRNGN